MDKIKIILPSHFPFSCYIPIRITDVNYGGHVGNHSVLGLLHEARLKFLEHYGLSELNFGGKSLIMRDVAMEFKSELFYGDKLKASVAVEAITDISFTLKYLLEKETENKTTTAVAAQTKMICFDYSIKKVVNIPDEVRKKWLM